MKQLKVISRIVALYLLILIPFLVFGQEKCRYVNVTFNDVHEYINTHVGNEYEYYATVNGEQIDLGSTVEYKLCENATLLLTCYAIDIDPSVDDFSRKQNRFSYYQLLKTTYFHKSTVIVTENRGRYSGETSSFTFEFTFKSEDDITSQSFYDYLPKGDAIQMIEFFFNDINNNKYTSAYKRCSNDLWKPFLNFMNGWKDIKNIKIIEYRYISRDSKYSPDEVVAIKYSGISKITGESINFTHDFLIKWTEDGDKIVRLLNSKEKF